jgi:hypothetical protein
MGLNKSVITIDSSVKISVHEVIIVSKAIAEAKYYKSLMVYEPHIEPYDMHICLHSTGS